MIPKGRPKKLHLPWTGPYRVLKKISDCDYRIKLPDSRKLPMVVHFNRLKLCPPSIRLSKYTRSKNATNSNTPSTTQFEIIDDDESDTQGEDTNETRSPSRNCQPPVRDSTVVTHL